MQGCFERTLAMCGCEADAAATAETVPPGFMVPLQDLLLATYRGTAYSPWTASDLARMGGALASSKPAPKRTYGHADPTSNAHTTAHAAHARSYDPAATAHATAQHTQHAQHAQHARAHEEGGPAPHAALGGHHAGARGHSGTYSGIHNGAHCGARHDSVSAEPFWSSDAGGGGHPADALSGSARQQAVDRQQATEEEWCADSTNADSSCT